MYKVLQDHKVQQDQEELHLQYKVLQVLVEVKVQLAQQVPLQLYKVQQDQKVVKDQRVLVLMDLKDQVEARVVKVLQVLQALLQRFKDLQVHKVLQVLLQQYRVLLVLIIQLKVLLVLVRLFKVHQVLQEVKVLQAQVEVQEHKVLMEHQEFKVLQVLVLVSQVHKVQRVLAQA